MTFACKRRYTNIFSPFYFLTPDCVITCGKKQLHFYRYAHSMNDVIGSWTCLKGFMCQFHVRVKPDTS